MKFPKLVHLAFQPADSNDEDDYLWVYTDGIDAMEPGQRCAIYQLVEEGVVQGPKSFVSKGKKREV